MSRSTWRRDQGFKTLTLAIVPGILVGNTEIDTVLLAKAMAALGLFTHPSTIRKDGSALYVNHRASSTVTRFDTATGQARAVITGFVQPRQGVRLSRNGAVLCVTNCVGDKITFVDSATNQITGEITGEITGFKMIRAISDSADGKTLFAGNSGKSACNGPCAALWPPMMADASDQPVAPTASSSATTGHASGPTSASRSTPTRPTRRQGTAAATTSRTCGTSSRNDRP